MEHFFGEEQWQDNMVWFEANQEYKSAFTPYYNKHSCQSGMNNNSANINKRMLKFIRTSVTESQESSSRRHRRKIGERLRRENERSGYLALHSMLPLGTKNEKNSIIQMAVKRIEELKGYKEELERRNHEFEKLGIENINERIEIRVDKPTSEIASIVEILKCLNTLGVKTTSIQSTLSDDHKLLAVIHVQTQIPVDEVIKAVQRTLQMEI